MTSASQTTALLEAVASMSEKLDKVLAFMEKKCVRKEYQAAYYKKRKAKQELMARMLVNPKGHCLEGLKDKRLPFDQFGTQLRAFRERGLSLYNFVTWLAWKWNHDTYAFAPITRSGGYYNVVIGMTGTHKVEALRHRYAERDVTGHLRCSTITRLDQIDTFCDALWWKWSYRVLYQVKGASENEVWYKRLPKTWHRQLNIAAGSVGCEVLWGDYCFEPNERDLPKATRAYRIVRPVLTCMWNAWRKGLFSKDEPFKIEKCEGTPSPSTMLR